VRGDIPWITSRAAPLIDIKILLGDRVPTVAFRHNDTAIVAHTLALIFHAENSGNTVPQSSYARRFDQKPILTRPHDVAISGDRGGNDR
jgi:hypothetical protein